MAAVLFCVLVLARVIFSSSFRIEINIIKMHVLPIRFISHPMLECTSWLVDSVRYLLTTERNLTLAQWLP